MFFSVIIPCIDFNQFLQKNITFLERQRFKNFEVIIVSENNFEDKVKDCNLNLKFIYNKKILTPGKKRNVASKEATGKYLAFIDDDAFPDELWLLNAYNFFQNKDYKICLGGPGLLPDDENYFGRLINLFFISNFFNKHNSRYFSVKKKNLTKVDDWPSVNFFISKVFFHQIYGFDESVWPGEDSKLCNNVLKNKGSIYYVSDCTVYHYKRSNIKKHFRQLYRYGFHRGKFFRNLDQNSFKFYYAIPSIFILCHFLYFIKKELFLFMFFIYFILLFIDMILLLSKEKNFILILLSRIFVYFNHITYGAGFILGFLKKKYKVSLFR